jgi:hypothetical protein
MNERIRELAEQVYGSAHYDDFKFAELIVRECIDIVPWMYEAKIKEHFGVEE